MVYNVYNPLSCARARGLILRPEYNGMIVLKPPLSCARARGLIPMLPYVLLAPLCEPLSCVRARGLIRKTRCVVYFDHPLSHVRAQGLIRLSYLVFCQIVFSFGFTWKIFAKNEKSVYLKPFQAYGFFHFHSRKFIKSKIFPHIFIDGKRSS